MEGDVAWHVFSRMRCNGRETLVYATTVYPRVNTDGVLESVGMRSDPDKRNFISVKIRIFRQMYDKQPFEIWEQAGIDSWCTPSMLLSQGDWLHSDGTPFEIKGGSDNAEMNPVQQRLFNNTKYFPLLRVRLHKVGWKPKWRYTHDPKAGVYITYVRQTFNAIFQ